MPRTKLQGDRAREAERERERLGLEGGSEAGKKGAIGCWWGCGGRSAVVHSVCTVDSNAVGDLHVYSLDSMIMIGSGLCMAVRNLMTDGHDQSEVLSAVQCSAAGLSRGFNG